MSLLSFNCEHILQGSTTNCGKSGDFFTRYDRSHTCAVSAMFSFYVNTVIAPPGMDEEDAIISVGRDKEDIIISIIATAAVGTGCHLCAKGNINDVLYSQYGGERINQWAGECMNKINVMWVFFHLTHHHRL